MFPHSPWAMACLFWPCSQDLGLWVLQVTFFVLLGKKGFWDRDLGRGAEGISGTFPPTRVLWMARVIPGDGSSANQAAVSHLPSLPLSLLLSLRAAGPYTRVPGTTWNVHSLTRPFTFAEWDNIRSQHRGHVALALRVPAVPGPT